MYSLGACCQSSICPQAPSGQGFWQPEVPFDEAIVTGVAGVAYVSGSCDSCSCTLCSVGSDGARKSDPQTKAHGKHDGVVIHVEAECCHALDYTLQVAIWFGASFTRASAVAVTLMYPILW